MILSALASEITKSTAPSGTGEVYSGDPAKRLGFVVAALAMVLSGSDTYSTRRQTNRRMSGPCAELAKDQKSWRQKSGDVVDHEVEAYVYASFLRSERRLEPVARENRRHGRVIPRRLVGAADQQ